MPCYRPIKAYKSRTTNPDTGNRSIAFKSKEGYYDLPIDLPCQQCEGCHIERSRQWALRCMHEASLYDDNCFLTLTYSPEHLPSHGTLIKKHIQDFMKRLRFHNPHKIRYYGCGEYGSKGGRAHYHLILFNHNFADKTHHSTSQSNKLYTSETLNSLWEHKGFCTIGEVTFQSAAYVARYVLKKTSTKSERYLDKESGYIKRRSKQPSQLSEFSLMSRRPGIGKPWFDKFKNDIYPDDFIVHDGKKLRPPQYYDRLYSQSNPTQFQQIKNSRINKAKQQTSHTQKLYPGVDRLSVKEVIQKSKLKKLIRGYENDT